MSVLFDKNLIDISKNNHFYIIIWLRTIDECLWRRKKKNKKMSTHDLMIINSLCPMHCLWIMSIYLWSDSDVCMLHSRPSKSYPKPRLPCNTTKKYIKLTKKKNLFYRLFSFPSFHFTFVHRDNQKHSRVVIQYSETQAMFV